MSPKTLHQLKVKLGNLYADAPEWKRVLMLSIDMSEGSIPTNGTAYEVWEEILRSISNDNDSMTKLLRFVTSPEEKGKNNKFLLDLLDTLEDAYKRQIDTLATAIKAKKCVLFLGPGLLMCSQKDGTPIPFNKAFAKVLAAKLKQRKEPIFFEEKKINQLSYIAQRYNEIPTFTPEDLGFQARQFYKDFCSTDTNIYTYLSSLYFPIIINTNPDKILYSKIMKKRPNSCIYRYYSFGNDQNLANEAQPIQNRNDELELEGEEPKTLFYNLLGSFDAPDSMILSESRLLKFMDKILKERPGIDKKIKAEFDDQKYYLFLGFDLEQWYVKILFSTVLGLSRQEGRGFSVFPENTMIDPSNQDFFEEEFKFFFITNDLGEFVKQLVKRYREL